MLVADYCQDEVYFVFQQEATGKGLAPSSYHSGVRVGVPSSSAPDPGIENQVGLKHPRSKTVPRVLIAQDEPDRSSVRKTFPPYHWT